MNCYGAKELADAFRTVRKNTLIIAEDIPEDKYGFQPAPDTRTVAHTLAHLAISTRWPIEMAKVKSMAGFDFPAFFKAVNEEENKPRSKAELIELLKSEGDRFASFLEGLNEDVLVEVIELPFGSKTRFEMMLGPKEHEMHHRGQLMVVERILGIVPHLTRQNQQRMADMEKARAATSK
jgi:uncharacterized damage-inducible protein DinB